MKRYIKIAFAYAIAGMVMGVFYREFTKFFAFNGKTTLAVVHLHLFAMGALMHLILGILAQKSNLHQQRTYKATLILYNVALPYMCVMFTVRGILQTVGATLTSGVDMAISGIAGIGHAAFGTAIVMLFINLLKADWHTTTTTAE